MNWISVQDRLPDVVEEGASAELLIAVMNGTVRSFQVGRYYAHGTEDNDTEGTDVTYPFWMTDHAADTVTHWLPIPPLPVENDQAMAP